jgi:hypothetical protein
VCCQQKTVIPTFTICQNFNYVSSLSLLISLLFLLFFCIHQLFDHPNYFNVLLSVTSFTFYLSSRTPLSLLKKTTTFLNVLNLCIIYPSKKTARQTIKKKSYKNTTTKHRDVSLDAAQSSIYCRVFTKTVMVCAILFYKTSELVSPVYNISFTFSLFLLLYRRYLA